MVGFQANQYHSKGSQASCAVWIEDSGFLSRPCRKRRPSSRRYRAWAQSWSSAALAARSVLPSNRPALASRVAQGVSGPSSSCVWNPWVFAGGSLGQTSAPGHSDTLSPKPAGHQGASLGSSAQTPSQLEGKIGLPRANPRGSLKSPSFSRIQTQVEKNDVVPTSSQDEALARYSVSREVPCSVLKWEMVERQAEFHSSEKT